MSPNDRTAQYTNWRACSKMSHLPHSFAEYYQKFGHRSLFRVHASTATTKLLTHSAKW
jgi:hypothetical protein